MYPLIDSHCHLTFDGLREQVDAVLDRARAAGIEACVTVATDLADAERALALSAEHEDVHVSAGIHPHAAGKVAAGWETALLRIVQREDLFAVGEIGLDYHYDFAPPADQARVFRRQLELAMQVDKPVVIHCREAQQDALSILSDFPGLRGVVFHCFTGTIAEADELLNRGYWLSLTGVVTFRKSAELREVAKRLPADRLMVETDAPYLSPEPVRGVRPNEPAHVTHTAACIAHVRGLSAPALAALTVENTRRFFSLPA
ncbi:MAG: TatD family hydrolase [Phycisphaerae bacterium]